MVQLTQEELNAINLLGAQAQQVQVQLTQIKAAQMSIVKLLEGKYEATFDEKTGTFLPKEKRKAE